MFVKSLILALAILMFESTTHTRPAIAPELENLNLVVRKSKRILELRDNERLIKTYKVVLGFKPEGDKSTEGDGRTPEGEFFVFTKNPESRFHLSIGISYPGKEDAERGLKDKLITREEFDEIISAIAEKRMPLQKTKLGGEIYIHGGGTASDWTDGCVALSNDEMTELFNTIQVGAKVTIIP